MKNRWITSDLHFKHKAICKFCPNRLNHMLLDGVIIAPNTLIDYRWYKGKADDVKGLNAAIEVTEKHDSWLVGRLNSIIGIDDDVYHTGDFSFGKGVDHLKELIGKLNGTWHFILGNHDNESHLREACKGTRHKVLGYYTEISVNGKRVCLMHYPIEEWNQCFRGSYHFHGHLHGGKGHGDFVLKSMKNRKDVGLDAHLECKPFLLEDLVDV